jgi:hypothetical protein
MLPDFERPDRIGEFYRNPKTRTFAELGALRARAARRAGCLAEELEPFLAHVARHQRVQHGLDRTTS